MRLSTSAWTAVGTGLLLLALTGCHGSEREGASSERPGEDPLHPAEDARVVRPFRPMSGDRWIGNAIAYGPFRDGQFPGGPSPSRAELEEDLHLMAEHWGLLRLYSATRPAETILEIIREDALDLKVMLGVWIDVEERRSQSGELLETFPVARGANRREVEAAIRLAALFPDNVLAVSVGNETQVSWSSHRVPTELLIDYVREVRERTVVPVTVADDFNFWNKPESMAVAEEVDFIVMNAHPLWNGILLEDALDWTGARFAEVQAVHPGRTLVLGETGWATRKHDVGEQAELIKGQPGEDEQAIFFEALTSWVEEERITTFFFEAFDENWKGGEHPDEVEKHWGLFRPDRTPKKARLR